MAYFIKYKDDGINASMAHDGPPDSFKVGQTYELDGTTFLVIKNARSDYVPSIIMTTIKKC